MKRFALMAAVLIWGLQNVSAQKAEDKCCKNCRQQTVEQRVERKVSRMKDCLKLTDKQVQELTEAYTKLMKEEEKTKMLREETEKKVNSILTDEQKEMRKKDKPGKPERRHRQAACAGPECQKQTSCCKQGK